MNTAQHKTTTVTRHEVRVENTSNGRMSRRDVSDLLHQADAAFEETKGRNAQYDDDYYVVGDEEGMSAIWETS